MKNIITKQLKGELVRFLFVGGAAVLIDAVGYYFLLQYELLNPSWAKRVSFALGSVWAFFMNKFYTFDQKRLRLSEPLIFLMVYGFGWFVNSIAHDIVFGLCGVKSLAFLFATGLSTCSNFIGQKWIVFKDRKGVAQ